MGDGLWEKRTPCHLTRGRYTHLMCSLARSLAGPTETHTESGDLACSQLGTHSCGTAPALHRTSPDGSQWRYSTAFRLPQLQRFVNLHEPGISVLRRAHRQSIRQCARLKTEMHPESEFFALVVCNWTRMAIASRIPVFGASLPATHHLVVKAEWLRVGRDEQAPCHRHSVVSLKFPRRWRMVQRIQSTDSATCWYSWRSDCLSCSLLGGPGLAMMDSSPSEP